VDGGGGGTHPSVVRWNASACASERTPPTNRLASYCSSIIAVGSRKTHHPRRMWGVIRVDPSALDVYYTGQHQRLHLLSQLKSFILFRIQLFRWYKPRLVGWAARCCF
jgi:hypothetical protein